MYVAKSQKLIAGADYKDQDGDVWGDPDKSNSDKMEELERKDM